MKTRSETILAGPVSYDRPLGAAEQRPTAVHSSLIKGPLARADDGGL